MNNIEYTPEQPEKKQHHNRRVVRVKKPTEEQSLEKTFELNQPGKVLDFSPSFSDKELAERKRIRENREKPLEKPLLAEKEAQNQQSSAVSDTLNPLHNQSIPIANEAFIPPPKRLDMKKTSDPAIGMENTAATPELKKQNSAEKVLLLCLLFVGVISGIMSVYHGYQYLIFTNKPSWVSLCTAVVMVFFSSFIFSIPIKGFLRYALRFFALATISFSIFCTISVSYEQFTEKETEIKSAEQSKIQINEAKSKAIEILESSIEDNQQKIKTLEKEAEYWFTQQWVNRGSNYERNRDEIQEAYHAIAENRGKIQEIIVSIEVEKKARKTMFDFLAAIFHVERSKIAFISYCIPAIFYDILSALAINAVFLQLKKK
jgi:hypothetical protein